MRILFGKAAAASLFDEGYRYAMQRLISKRSTVSRMKVSYGHWERHGDDGAMQACNDFEELENKK